MALIPIERTSPELRAVVDDEDYERLTQYSWSALLTKRTYYAYTIIRRKNIYMHRMIMDNPSKRFQVDHVDSNGLNNRRYNLRVVTRSQQQQNRRKSSGTASRFKGVARSKEGKWQARITIDGHQYHLGTYENEGRAADVYNFTAVLIFGNHARLN